MSSIPISYQTTTSPCKEIQSAQMSSIPISYQTTTGELLRIAAIKMSSIPISYQTTTDLAKNQVKSRLFRSI